MEVRYMLRKAWATMKIGAKNDINRYKQVISWTKDHQRVKLDSENQWSEEKMSYSHSLWWATVWG